MKHSKTIIFGASIGIIFFFGIIVNKLDVNKILAGYNLLPVPESYTELYFEDILKLPKVFKINEEKEFSFTIHNLENKKVLYNYTVMANASDSASLLDKGQVSLDHDKSKTITEKFTIRSPHQKVKLTVNLENINQSIHFYTEITYK